MREKLPPSRLKLLSGVLALADLLLLIGLIILLLPKGPPMGNQTAARETVEEEVRPQNMEAEGKGEDELMIRAGQVKDILSPSPAAEQETGEISPEQQSDYILPDSDSRYLAAAELQGLTDWELKLARNEIYARHGRIFKDEKIAEYFSEKPWYTPVYSPEEFDRKGDILFNTFEIENRKLIQSIEDAR